jgi:hypothetical protein
MPLYHGYATNTEPGLITLNGDLGGTPILPTVININGASIPSAGSLVTGNVLQVSGASSLVYGAINLAGGDGYITGILPEINQASQIMSGDVTGTTSSSVVSKVNGITITGTPIVGQVIVSTSPTTASWQNNNSGFRTTFLLMGA